MPDKDHIEMAQKHISSQDENRYARANAHSMLALAIEAKRIADALEELVRKEQEDDRVLEHQRRARVHQNS